MFHQPRDKGDTSFRITAQVGSYDTDVVKTDPVGMIYIYPSG